MCPMCPMCCTTSDTTHRFLDLPKFVKAYQTSKTPSPRQDKFLSGVKSDRFVNLNAVIRIWSLFLVGVPPKLNLYLRDDGTKHGRFVPRYAPWRSVGTVQLLRFPSLRTKLCSVCTSVCSPESAEYKYKYKFHDYMLSNWKQPSWLTLIFGRDSVRPRLTN